MKAALINLWFALERAVTAIHSIDDEPFDPSWMDAKRWKETRA